jgi:hypothetical protein
MLLSGSVQVVSESGVPSWGGGGLNVNVRLHFNLEPKLFSARLIKNNAAED